MVWKRDFFVVVLMTVEMIVSRVKKRVPVLKKKSDLLLVSEIVNMVNIELRASYRQKTAG